MFQNSSVTVLFKYYCLKILNILSYIFNYSISKFNNLLTIFRKLTNIIKNKQKCMNYNIL